MPTKTQLEKCLEKLRKNLNALEERKAKYGLEVPLALINQIDDHQEAIELVEQTIDGQLSETELDQNLASLIIDLRSCTQSGIFSIIPKPFLIGGLVIGAAIALLLFLITPQAQFLAPQPTATPLFTTPAAPDELLTLVAEFENPEGVSIKAGQRIFRRLQEEIARLKLTGVRLELAPKIDNAREAAEVGQTYGAVFVIWGWTDDVSIVPNFSITKPVADELQFTPMIPEKLLDVPDFKFFIATELPEQMAFLSEFTLGQIYFREGDYEQAEELFELPTPPQALNIPDEDLAIVYFYQGFTAFKLNKLEEALPLFTQALSFDPSLYQTYHNRGVVYMVQRDYEKAILDFNQAIEIQDDEADTYAYRGYSLIEQGQYQAALVDIEQALALDPTAAHYYFYQALAHEAMDNPEQALIAYDHFIELSPDFPIAYVNRALMYQETDQYDRAEADLQQALALDSQHEFDIPIRRSLGWFYYANRDFTAAIEANRAILADYQDLTPDHPQFIGLLITRYNLALVLLVDGQTDLAEAEYDTALSLGPIPFLVEAALKDLEELQAKQPDTAGVSEMIDKLRAHLF